MSEFINNSSGEQEYNYSSLESGATTWEDIAQLADSFSEYRQANNTGPVPEIAADRQAHEDFARGFQEILSMDVPEGMENRAAFEAQNIRHYFAEQLNSGAQLTVQEVATALCAVKDRGDNEGVIEIYESGTQLGADRSAVLKEFYAVSLNKVGRLEDSANVAAELMQDDNARVGEVSGILGKVRKLQSAEAVAPAEKIEYMQQSVDALREGFYQTYEYYPGINLVYNQIELANLQSDPSLIGRAFDDAELVLYATKKAGAERTSDYWSAATLLEASVFAGEVTPRIINNCIGVAQHDWELGATTSNLRSVADTIGQQLAAGHLQPDLAARLSQVRETILGTDDQPGVLARLEQGLSSEDQNVPTPNDSVLGQGFMYGETTTLIGGNVKFGGQLQDHIVNRFDAKVAYGLINQFGLDSVNSAEDFSDIIDPIIRRQFGTANLEDLHSDYHATYDAQIRNLLEVTGVDESNRASADTRTNVMLDFLLGKGDCRQHAHAKQLLFDSWKTFKVNSLIDELRDAQDGGSAQERAEIKAQIDDLLSKQMLVFDSVISSRVKMNSIYDPDFTPEGQYQLSDHLEDIEEHTWNGLVTFGKDGHVKSMEMADSFYQTEYGLGGRHQVLEDVSGYANGGMVVTGMSAVDANGRAVTVPVVLRPTVYAGDRGGRNIDMSADDGGARLRGVFVSYYKDEALSTLGSPDVERFWQAMAA